ncbi:unnamed protein product [Caenorhabditis auriculariae]|uniref:Uncharacterized protein n=1 Tax=Caenorhabditis auriculariae TaxID=2777116 RepID=A0A8S1HNT2_9PELO|nr:unnamed protein product [Caenorhabditis auriculariae]
MPSPPSSKILYEEGTTHGDLTTWAPTSSAQGGRRRARKSRLPCICVAVTAVLLMFLIGLSVGAFLHQLVFPDGGSPLAFISFSASSNKSTRLEHAGIVNTEEEEKVLTVTSEEKDDEGMDEEKEETDSDDKEESDEDKNKEEDDVDER